MGDGDFFQWAVCALGASLWLYLEFLRARVEAQHKALATALESMIEMDRRVVIQSELIKTLAAASVAGMEALGKSVDDLEQQMTGAAP